MSLIMDKIIGILMTFYRKSPFHSQKNGAFLAKMLSFYLLSKNKKIEIKNIKGISYELDLSEIIDVSLYFSDTFEKPEEIIIENYLKPGMTAFDIGANFGYHTFRMASLVNPSGKVFAFEPTAWAFDKFKRNLKLYPSINNIFYFNIGLSDNDSEDVKNTFQSSYRIDGNKTITHENISLYRVDTFVRENKINRLDFIKMDVDGYEGKVIKGAKNTIRTFKPKILFEFNPSLIISYGDDPQELINTLLSLGYEFRNNFGKIIPDLSNFIANNNSLMIFGTVK